MLDFEDPNIKIVRLTSGEDIIADCIATEDEEVVRLKEPMHIIFKRIASGKTIMLMMPWLPVEIIKENEACIYDSDILTSFEPKKELVEYYMKAVIENEAHLATASGMSSSYFDDEDEEPTDEELDDEELEEILKERKTQHLH